MIAPVSESKEYRGVAYTLQGDFVNEERTVGRFVWRCRYGFGVAGDPEKAREHLRWVINANLGPEEPSP